ncbi:MAG: dethiobiotin synthase [Actinomycetia bacterium]|nr:dethiobiotin synthase [Actinomycetes bacterium]
MKKIFVTGIGTEIGKTVVSAILVEALKADYWKPIQAGDLENSDTIKVKNLISNSETVFYPESYRLNRPASPHAAAAIDNVTIELRKILLPETQNNIIIEGAGGLMVPLNDHDMMIDFIKHLNAEVVLVYKHYLGSINHTILSIEALKQRRMKITGIVFNGKSNPETEDIILRYTGIKLLGKLDEEESITKETIKIYSEKFKII